MRRLIIITIALLGAPILADAAPIQDKDSTELRRCVSECRNMDDAEKREACQNTCARAEKKRKNKDNPAAGLPNSK